MSRGEEVDLGTAGQDLFGERELAAGLHLNTGDNRTSVQKHEFGNKEL